MNPQHMFAVLWLRWRILRNRVRRASKLGNFMTVLLLGLAGLASVGLFVAGFGVGKEELPDLSPPEVMMAWVFLAIGFLFFYTIGLLTDLQRSDAMSLKNLLHLPTSLGWVFLYNYLSSFVALSVALFLPLMLGFWLAMLLVHGSLAIWGLPLIAGFFVMVTALTYQLRGWLARMMADKRRGQNIVAMITILFVLLLQVPNLVNMGMQQERSVSRREKRELRLKAYGDGEEAQAAQAELDRLSALEDSNDQQLLETIHKASIVLPPGWLPLGMRQIMEGRWYLSGLCSLGMLLIGASSLALSYRSTLRGVTGGGRQMAVPAVAAPSGGGGQSPGLPANRLERSLPLASPPTSAISLACLTSFLRSPEAKLMLMSPVILLALSGVLLADPDKRAWMQSFAPSLSLGGVAMGMICVVPLLQNGFGLDRHGFRALVLSPVSRSRILLAKNLSTAPVAMGIGLVAILGLQFLFPTSPAHLVGSLMQLVSAYLITCMLGNLMSILNPVRFKEGTMKANHANIKTVLLQIASVFLIPLSLAPLAIPSLLETLARFGPLDSSLPIYFLGQAAGLLLISLLYSWLIRRQGALLQQREQNILEVITRD